MIGAAGGRKLVTMALALIAVATLIPGSSDAANGVVRSWYPALGDYGLADAIANVALFVPLGWALTVAGVRPRHAVAVVLATTITVEFLQYTIVAGRQASVWDVLANGVGGLIGMVLPHLRSRIMGSPPFALRAAALYGVAVVAGIAGGVLLQAVPPPGALRWTNQDSHRPAYMRFEGTINDVRMNGRSVPAEAWTEIPAGRVTIDVDLASALPSPRLAEIIQFWLPDGRGWGWVDQLGRDLRVFAVSRSDAIRLRGHSLWVREAMPSAAGEPVALHLELRRFAHEVVVRNAQHEVRFSQRISAGDGWQLFAPFARQRERWGGSSLLQGLWMALLLAPLGYAAAARSLRTVAGAGAGVAVGLLLLPIALGCAWLPVWGWCGVVGGILAGAGVGRAALRGQAPDAIA